MSWMERVHIPFLKRQHQEGDHSKISIKKYVAELLHFIGDWSIVERRKLLKICETTKLRSGEKYCLAFHPSQVHHDFVEMDGVKLKDLKDHVNSAGGAWGRDTWACLVSDEVDGDFEQTGIQSGLDDTKSKRAILIPISVFPSAQIMRICDLLGQNEDYRRFGADEETPSGVESSSVDGLRNSTQLPGSQGISLNNISSIDQVINQDVDQDEIDFDTLEPPHETFFDEGEASEDDQDVDDEPNESRNSQFRAAQVMKNTKNANRTITEVTILSKTSFVCECGYSSGNKSATTRHKCRNGSSVLFNCLECEKMCSNPGSLKRHVNSKHKSNTENISNNDQDISSQVDTSSISANLTQQKLTGKSGALSDSRIRSILSNTGNSQGSQDGRFQCMICPKSLKTQKNLERHLLLVHKKEPVPENSSAEVMERPTSLDHENQTSEEVEAAEAAAPPKAAVVEAAVPPHAARPQLGRRDGARRRSISLQRHKGRRK